MASRPCELFIIYALQIAFTQYIQTTEKALLSINMATTILAVGLKLEWEKPTFIQSMHAHTHTQFHGKCVLNNKGDFQMLYVLTNVTCLNGCCMS